MSILVTGATGFVANHIVDQLLSQNQTVIGTGRSQERVQPFQDGFKAKYPNGKLTYEFVQDISKEGAFDDLLQKHKDIKYVLHTASPFTFGLDKSYEDAFYTPAINGTKNILKAIKAYAPQVEHVVVTSSFAAIVSNPITELYTNEDWNPITFETVENENDAYRASKKFAEKAAWGFVEAESPNFTLSTVNPPFIFGPQVFESAVGKTLNTSNEVIAKLLRLDADNIEFAGAPNQLYVDVRDVAAFHILPITNKKLRNFRSFVAAGQFVGQDILNIINENLTGDFAKGQPDHETNYFINYDIKNVVEKADNYKFIPLKKTIIDTVEQYLKVNRN